MQPTALNGLSSRQRLALLALFGLCLLLLTSLGLALHSHAQLSSTHTPSNTELSTSNAAPNGTLTLSDSSQLHTLSGVHHEVIGPESEPSTSSTRLALRHVACGLGALPCGYAHYAQRARLHNARAPPLHVS